MFRLRYSHRLALLTAILTWFLLIAGALVTSTGSGLSVPDWPLSYGRWMPPMVGGVFYEHGHRMVAGTVALFMLATALVTSQVETRPWVRILCFTALGLVLVQAVLGGLTVLLRLPPVVSISHALLAQTFFCLITLLACVTSPAWRPGVVGSRPGDRGVFFLSLLLSVGFFVQLFLGATVRHLHAGLVIPDFPTVYGGFLPPVWSLPIGFHFAHRWMAYFLFAGALALAVRVWRGDSTDRILRGLAAVWVGLLFTQILLGALTIWLRRPVPVTAAHLAVGALCLVSSVLLSFRIGWSALSFNPVKTGLRSFELVEQT